MKTSSRHNGIKDQSPSKVATKAKPVFLSVKSGLGEFKTDRKPVRRDQFFKFILPDYEDDGLRNLAECMGVSHHQLFKRSLMAYAKEVEKVLGFGVVEASKMSKKQIREVANRVRVIKHLPGWNHPDSSQN